MGRILFIGSNLDHSLLPLVYELISEQLHIPLHTTMAQVNMDEFKSIITNPYDDKFTFYCVTFPYKGLAANLIEKKTERAARYHSINIIYKNKNKEVIGDSTDGIGFMNDFNKRSNLQLRDANVLILGNGGVSRTILYELADQKANIWLCCRKSTSNPSKIERSACKICTYESIPNLPFQLVVNTTSASIFNEVPPLQINQFFRDAFFYECAYLKKDKTEFERFLKSHLIKNYCNGIGMLVEQAALAINSLYNVQIDTDKVFNKLIKLLEIKSQGIRGFLTLTPSQ